jgi:predicted aldo/keto reductase-like oxidoreductase
VTGPFEAFETLRDQGKTKWLAASLHASPDMLQACVDDGRFKMIQICYNPPGSNDAWIAALKSAQAAGVAVIVMKSMAGGPAKWAESEAAKAVLQHYFDQGASPAVAMLRWILAQPGVTSIVPDSPNVKIAEENCSAAGAKLTAWEHQGIERFAAAMSGIWCRSCRTCEGSCPRVLPIPDLLRYRMYSKDYGQVDGARKLYAALDEDRRASACIGCGECEKACPYGLHVRDFLADAHRRLS